MFGMLDYRAHKLFWLLSRPLWLSSLLLMLAASVGSCLIAVRLVENAILQFIVALIAFQVLGVVVFFLVWILQWVFERAFLFIVDVVPTDGRNNEQAKIVLRQGELGVLSLKPISLWDASDVELTIRKGGVVCRLLFAEKVRTRYKFLVEKNREWRAQEHADGSDLSEFQAKRLLEEARISPSWYEVIAIRGYWRTVALNQLLLIVIFFSMKRVM